MDPFKEETNPLSYILNGTLNVFCYFLGRVDPEDAFDLHLFSIERHHEDLEVIRLLAVKELLRHKRGVNLIIEGIISKQVLDHNRLAQSPRVPIKTLCCDAVLYGIDVDLSWEASLMVEPCQNLDGLDLIFPLLSGDLHTLLRKEEEVTVEV